MRARPLTGPALRLGLIALMVGVLWMRPTKEARAKEAQEAVTIEPRLTPASSLRSRERLKMGAGHSLMLFTQLLT